MENIKKHLDILGLKVEDKVTGMTGVATSISFDLYGCVQVIIDPGLDKDGKPRDGRWYDIGRLAVKTKKPVMQQPVWDMRILEEEIKKAKGKKGPADKPVPNG